MVAALAFLAAAGCHSLEVANPNDPDVTRALASGGDVQSLLGGGFRNWYHTLADVDPTMAWDVTADHYESPWGNWAMRYEGWEPRIYPYVNSHTDPNTWTPVGEEIWYNNYAAVVSANLVLKALAPPTNVAIPGPGPGDSASNPMIRAAAKFMQGAAMSQIALAYDSGYALDENTDVTKIKLVGRDSVQKAALAKLDQAVTLATGASWSIPEVFLNQIGEAWTAAQLAKVANTFAARLIAYYPRSAAENAAANWAKVLTYASAGISSGAPFDMEIIGDGPMDPVTGLTPNEWVNDHLGIGESFQIWTRVDFRVVCLLDPTYKCHKANNGSFPRMPQSPDWRFNGDGVSGDNCVDPSIISISNVSAGEYCTAAGGTGSADFMYDSLGADWPGFSPARGYYRFSPVAHVRYWNIGYDSPDNYVGRLPFVLAAENDLLWAEAVVRTTGPSALAAAKINKTRVTRGHLPALTGSETLAQTLSAIIYEKAVELFATGDRVAYYDARRWSAGLTNPHYYTAADDSDQTGWGPYGTGLQPGSVRNFPVPAQELTLLGGTIYTFGGVSCSAPNSCVPTNPDMASPVRGSAQVRGGSIFGTAPDGRVILGPGKYNAIADEIFAANRRARAAMRSRM